MIKTFADQRTKDIAEGKNVRNVPPNIQKTATRRLEAMAAATDLRDLSAPGNDLKKHGGRSYYSVRVNDQWRIFFLWDGGHATDVLLEDPKN